jgi:ATP-binding cassette subfamily B protein
MRGRMPKSGNEGKVAKRLLKDLFARYKKELIAVFILLIFTSISNVTGSLFTPKIINEVITPVTKGLKTFSEVSGRLLELITIMGILYAVGITSSLLYTRIMAKVTQYFLNDMREKTFAHMQTLPIKYFDRRTHGDIMSVYTNDIDAIRQLVGGSLPNLIHSAMIIFGLVVIMFSYSIWLSLIVFLGVILMFITTKYVGGNSGKYFMLQQKTLGQLEGYV